MIENILDAGVRLDGRAAPLPDRSAESRIPFEPWPAGIATVSWNVLFLVDLFGGGFPGIPTLVALWSAFLVATGLLSSRSFRALVTTGEEDFFRIRNHVRFSQVVFGLLACSFTLAVVLTEH